jgi:hypothetical protein
MSERKENTLPLPKTRKELCALIAQRTEALEKSEEERTKARLNYEATADEGQPKALRYLAERLAARREYLANLNVVLPPPSQQVFFHWYLMTNQKFLR